MFKTALGVKIPYPEKIKEQYQQFEYSLTLNVSFPKIEPMLRDFIDLIKPPLFIALHVPLSKYEEDNLRQSEADPLHEHIYYIDGLSKQQVFDILDTYGEIILNDGISKFAVASHVTNDVFFIQKYKLIDIISEEPNKFFSLMDKYSIKKTSQIITVWDTFCQSAPSKSSRVEINGKNIFDVVDKLIEIGMYHAKVAED